MDKVTQKVVTEFIKLVSMRYETTGFILFGSRARDSHQPDSDVDLAILMRGERGDFVDTKLAMADIAYDLLLEFGIRIQPLPIWEGEWQHPDSYPNPRLLHNIERDGIRL
jgi:predicted nucleotidyltransferase